MIAVAYKKIKLRPQKSKVAEEIREHLKSSEIVARILAARGFKPDKDLQTYINPTLKEGLPDPAELKGLHEASTMIAQVLAAGEGIGIACDFDVDGLSGGAQVFHFLKALGAHVEIFVPDRFADGYGLNEGIIRTAHDHKLKLFITVDFGTTNVKEIELARALGMKTIVIDHHHVGDVHAKPDVFINPNQSGCGFAGKVLSASGLAWYLLVGVKKASEKASNIDVRHYLDLACLGTICDMVPLTGVNRVIAKRGLEVLSNTTRAGLIALKNVIGIKKDVSCHDVGFGIGPRINAAGRMVHGEVVIDLLTTNDTDKAQRLAGRLNRLNTDRQDMENKVKLHAIQLIEERGELEPGLVVWNKEFHTGVIGIVAQRLVENFYRPSVVMGVDSDGKLKGSVRGIKGFSVVGALTEVGHTLVKYGGHEGAGGLTLLPERLEEFCAAFKKVCAEKLSKIETSPFVEADTEVSLDELEAPLVQELGSFSPFGMGNPAPLLLTKKLKVMDVKVLKNTHMKATLTDGTRYISGMLWRHSHHPALIQGTSVNAAYRLDTNSYGGNLELQANLQAVERV